MNKYMEECKEMLIKFNSRYPKYGKKIYIHINDLKELVAFLKIVCEKAQMYDDLCK